MTDRVGGPKGPVVPRLPSKAAEDTKLASRAAKGELEQRADVEGASESFEKVQLGRLRHLLGGPALQIAGVGEEAPSLAAADAEAAKGAKGAAASAKGFGGKWDAATAKGGKHAEAGAKGHAFGGDKLGEGGVKGSVGMAKDAEGFAKGGEVGAKGAKGFDGAGAKASYDQSALRTDAGAAKGSKDWEAGAKAYYDQSRGAAGAKGVGGAAASKDSEAAAKAAAVKGEGYEAEGLGAELAGGAADKMGTGEGAGETRRGTATSRPEARGYDFTSNKKI